MFGFYIGDSVAPPKVVSIPFKPYCPEVQLGDVLIRVNDVDAYYLTGAKARQMLLCTPEGFEAKLVFGRQAQSEGASEKSPPKPTVAVPSKSANAGASSSASPPKPARPAQGPDADRAKGEDGGKPAKNETPSAAASHSPAAVTSPASSSKTTTTEGARGAQASGAKKTEADKDTTAASETGESGAAPAEAGSDGGSAASDAAATTDSQLRPARRPTDRLKQNPAMSSMAAAMTSGLNQRKPSTSSKASEQ